MVYKDLEARRAYLRKWRGTHREELIVKKRAYREAHREEYLAFNRAWREAHREEDKARYRAYREAHREEVREHNRRHQALKRGAAIGRIDVAAIKVRDRMRCAICGKKVTEKEFSLDHTIPLSLGGAHTQENLRVAHIHCNKRRGAGRLPVQMVLV